MTALYLFAMDHRGWLSRSIASLTGQPERDVEPLVRRVKKLCYEGVSRAVANGVAIEHAGILVDEQYGVDIARRARAAGFRLSIPIERADQDVFEPEYGPNWMKHVAMLGPELPKVLVRHNVEAPREALDEQLRRVREVADGLHDAGDKLLLELLVPATSAQLAAVGSDTRRYDDELRPGLTLQAVDDFRSVGIEPDCWKIEGMTSEADSRALAAACQADSRATCLVLGRNADWPDVERWLRNAARSDGFDGFAIGRTLWWQEAADVLTGSDWDEAVERIAANYRRCVDCYEQARGA